MKIDDSEDLTTAPIGPEHAVRTDALLRPWALRQSSQALTFRGRVKEGTASLPSNPVPGQTRGFTFGLANTPLLLKNVGGSYPVPANTVWAVPSDGTWRVVFSQQSDLRLIHCDAAAVKAPVMVRRPLRFAGEEREAMRAAVKTGTPIWVDDKFRPVANLVSLGQGDQAAAFTARPIGAFNDPDVTVGFLTIAIWAVEAQQTAEDQRLARVIDYIDAAIADPALSTASVATHTKLSRRTLQTLFARQGGVAAYIRRRRLAAALSRLAADPAKSPDLEVVAEETGFGSRRTLERAMRQTYGLTPRQARAHVLAGTPLRELPVAELKAS